jgi:putative sigma-54 modulation protein
MTTLADIKFTGQNIEITDALKEIATKKITKNIIKHYTKWITNGIDVIIKIDNNDAQIAEMNVHVHEKTLNATAKTDDIYKSIDEMIHKMEVQLEKFKGKNLGHQQ